jgi:hypothetical protein
MSATVMPFSDGPTLMMKNTFLEYVGITASPALNSRARTFTDSGVFAESLAKKELNSLTPVTKSPGMSDSEGVSDCSVDMYDPDKEGLHFGSIWAPLAKMSHPSHDLSVSTNEEHAVPVETLCSPSFSPWHNTLDCMSLEAFAFQALPPAASPEYSGWWWPQGDATEYGLYEWPQAEYMACSSSMGFNGNEDFVGSAPSASILCGQPESSEEAVTSAERSDFDRFVRKTSSAPNVDCDDNNPSRNTTVMLRNLPVGFTRAMLLELIDSEGYFGMYDFVYAPVDFGTGTGLGYGFVNLHSAACASDFWKHFSGFSRWSCSSDKVCAVAWGEPCQGLSQHLERYRNSPVMHDSVPDEWRPIFLVEGVRVDFPEPTKRIKAPKIRNRLESTQKL